MFKTVRAQQHLSKFASHSTLRNSRCLSTLKNYGPNICEETFLIHPHLHAFFYCHSHHLFSRIMEQNGKRFWDLLQLSIRMTTCLSQLVWSVEICFLDMQARNTAAYCKERVWLCSQGWLKSACEWWMCQQMALIARVRTNECRTTLWRSWRIRKDLQDES